MSCPKSPSKISVHVIKHTMPLNVKNIMSLAAYYLLLHVFSYTMPLHVKHNMHERTCELQSKAVHKQIFWLHTGWTPYMGFCHVAVQDTHLPYPRAMHVDDGVQQATMKPTRLHESFVSLLYIFELKRMLAYCSQSNKDNFTRSHPLIH